MIGDKLATNSQTQ